MKFKIHIEENLVVNTDDADMVELVFSYLVQTETRVYRISTEHAALIVKDGKVYRRDRVNPDELQLLGNEDLESMNDYLGTIYS